MKNLITFLLFSVQINLAAQNLNEGLVLYLPFDGNANDETVSFLNGRVVNAQLTTGHDGLENHAYAFNGVDAYIVIPHSEAFNFGPNDNFTISLWIKQAGQQNLTQTYENDVFSKWVYEDGSVPDVMTGGYPFVVRILNQTNPLHGLTKFIRFDGYPEHGGCVGSGDNTVSQPFNDNKWHHFVFRKFAHTGILNSIVDGVDYGQELDQTGNDAIGCTTINNAPLIIGARYNGYGYFTGAIDELRIWNRQLSDEEIGLLFTGTKAEESVSASLDVFPNPSNGNVILQTKNQERIEYIELFTSSGIKIAPHSQNINGDKAEISFSNFQGLALAKIWFSDGRFAIERLVVE